MVDDILKETRVRMDKTCEALKVELGKIRTGRAHPSILDHVTVDYYGNETPLKQVANVNVEDARTLAISPWEKAMIPAIEKAIMTADLGLNPVTSGEVVRVPMPPLTEERRRDMVKLVKEEAEKSRVSVRNARRDANGDFKDLLKEKEMTEDDEKRAEQQVQKLTDAFIKSIDDIASKKEADLMAV